MEQIIHHLPHLFMSFGFYTIPNFFSFVIILIISFVLKVTSLISLGCLLIDDYSITFFFSPKKSSL